MGKKPARCSHFRSAAGDVSRSLGSAPRCRTVATKFRERLPASNLNRRYLGCEFPLVMELPLLCNHIYGYTWAVNRNFHFYFFY